MYRKHPAAQRPPRLLLHLGLGQRRPPFYKHRARGSPYIRREICDAAAHGVQLNSFVGHTMTVQRFLLLLVLASALSLESCSGVKSGGGNGGGGTAKVFITLTASPLTPPSSTNLLSFNVSVAGISLTPTGGGTPVNISLNNASYSVDLTRLQSDSAFVAASTNVATGTYSAMTVSLASPLVTYCTQTTGATGCATGSVATFTTGAAAAPQITTAPFPLTLSANQTHGLAININLQNALTVATNQTVTAVNLGATNVVTASTLPPAVSSLPSGPLSFIEDVVGVVTSVSASAQSVTVQTATRGSFTAVANSLTVFSPNCTSFNLSLTFGSCVVQGHVASLDLVLNTDGTFTLLEYDPLATTTGDWMEGIITAPPTSISQFQLVTNEFVRSTTNSLIGTSFTLGDPVNVTLSSPQPFVVDTKGLVVPSTTFTGSADTSRLQPGQTVAVRLSAFTAGSGSTFTAASVNFLYLRFTRVTGTVVAANPPNTFSMQSFPPFFGVTVPLTVQLSNGSPSTNFDGVSSASGVAASQTISVSALYHGPPTGPTPAPMQLSAATVRVP